MESIFGSLSRLITSYFVFPGILIVGLYLTLRLRFVQFSRLKMGFLRLVRKESEGEGNISHYQAVATVLAGSFGTGNISGTAVALTMGGPGAVVWMWVMALFGTVIQYASCLLGVKYREKSKEGHFRGGPMYYLSKGLGWKRVAFVFAFLVMFASVAAGAFAQTNSVVLPLTALGIRPWLSGVAIAVGVALVLQGGGTRFANVASSVVPFMALLYLGGAVWILILHAKLIGPALLLIVRSAFGFESALGGAVGFSLMRALTSGFDRAIFATDAGTGSVPILQAQARSPHPVIDGVVSLVAPLLVMVVCTTTALVLIVTGAFGQMGLESTNLVTFAFNEGLQSPFGGQIVLLALVLFAYTTILAWATCGMYAASYLFGDRGFRLFRLFFILMVPLGALLRVGMVWLLADLALALMLVINLAGVLRLSKEVVRDSREFFVSKISFR